MLLIEILQAIILAIIIESRTEPWLLGPFPSLQITVFTEITGCSK